MNLRKEKPFPSRKVEQIDHLKETISAYPHFYLVDVTALDSVATSELRIGANRLLQLVYHSHLT